MSTNLEQYTNARIFLNSSELIEAGSVTVARATNNQQVNTIAKGFAGITPGAQMTEITVENAVPSSDFEVNPDQFMKTNEVVELTIFAAGRTLTVKGFIMSDNFQYAHNQSSSLSFQFIGGPALWD